ncbi:MAG: hypothetical protein CM15mP49_30630 [Actinomycetota bacterium]|nr:MAG: hypothetical protein CM15mP49_30630 [Actinomycetota bacterium]
MARTFYDERYSEVHLQPDLPDIRNSQKQWDVSVFELNHPEEVKPAIDQANEINDRPVVIDFRTEASENVYPMVPAGKSNSDVIVHPSQGND